MRLTECSSNVRRRGRVRRSIGVLILLALLGCNEPGTAPSEGSNSNWLVACASDAECDAASACRCGGCTRECSEDAACGDLENARCALPSENGRASQCRGADASSSFGICLPRCSAGSCLPEQACVEGSCVMSPRPSSAFCRTVPAPDANARTWHDQLLQALNEARAAGGVSCGSDPPSSAAAPLRLDPRLSCAASVLASDMNTTRMRSLIDSLGRSTEQRMNTAGYSDAQWAESFAMKSRSATEAVNVMLGDASSCPHLVDAIYRDVGVALIGDVSVITIGSE